MAIESLEKLDMSKKIDRFKFTRRIMQDNHTHIDDCNCAIELCTLVDELQARAEAAEQSKAEAWVLIDELTVSLQQALEQGERRFNEVAQERDKLRAALEHAESHIQEMENAEGRAFFADTTAMAKKLGDTMQERDALAERVKALEVTLGVMVKAVDDDIQYDIEENEMEGVIYCSVCCKNITIPSENMDDNHYNDCTYIAACKLLENDHA